jgi:hypothetical protein
VRRSRPNLLLALAALLAACSEQIPMLPDTAREDAEDDADVASDVPVTDTPGDGPDAGPDDAVGPDGPLDDAGPGPDADADVEEDVDATIVIDWPERRVGIFYLAWHAYAVKAMQRIPEGERLTVEAVIRDDPAAFGDMLLDRGLHDVAMAFHYHLTPEAGYYCLYRPRPGEAPYDEPFTGPDCGDIASIAARHARQVWDAGVDFVYVDLTNLPTFSPFGDVIGLRPLEVLLEEWHALRRAGTPTPQIAAWVPARAVGAGETPMLRRVLDVYAAWAGTDMLLEHAPAGQPVVFVVAGDDVDDGLLAEARSRGVLPVRLWGNLDNGRLAAGDAGWMQPCTQSGAFTTLLGPGIPCRQGYTATSPLGTVVSVSYSFQVGYASLPFQAAGRNEGLTLQKQFETAFEVQPNYLLVNAWNELIAQPQPNPHAPSLGSLRRSMGVGSVDGDGLADSLWVDMYGVEFDRDLEPTVEGGDAGLQLLTSCLRVYRSGVTTCSSPTEACCQLARGFNTVWSLRRRGTGTWGGDHVLTISDLEKQVLVDGGAFEEVCNPFYGPPGMCGGGTTGDGPFRLWAADGPGRALLYRCLTSVGHFFSLDPACEGTTVEGPLGWVSTTRSSTMPRPLRRCYNPGALAHFHWLDEHCPSDPGVLEEPVLGFVR